MACSPPTRQGSSVCYKWDNGQEGPQPWNGCTVQLEKRPFLLLRSYPSFSPLLVCCFHDGFWYPAWRILGTNERRLFEICPSYFREQTKENRFLSGSFFHCSVLTQFPSIMPALIVPGGMSHVLTIRRG